VRLGPALDRARLNAIRSVSDSRRRDSDVRGTKESGLHVLVEEERREPRRGDRLQGGREAELVWQKLNGTSLVFGQFCARTASEARSCRAVFLRGMSAEEDQLDFATVRLWSKILSAAVFPGW
jgi:hypothetical protein